MRPFLLASKYFLDPLSQPRNGKWWHLRHFTPFFLRYEPPQLSFFDLRRHVFHARLTFISGRLLVKLPAPSGNLD